MMADERDDAAPGSEGLPSRVQLWVDPSCPWAWQTSTWLRELRDRGLLEITWRLFSLELNASEPHLPFWEASFLYGEAHVTLALAGREGGSSAFEALYVALGTRLHRRKEPMTEALLDDAAEEAGLEGFPRRARADASLVEEILAGQVAARDLSVFGVPTFTVDGSKPAYGPILSLAPSGEDALAWWGHIRWLAGRPDFFEMKRWPRDLRPGEGPSPA